MRIGNRQGIFHQIGVDETISILQDLEYVFAVDFNYYSFQFPIINWRFSLRDPPPVKDYIAS
jgi:hypothetical protein